MDINTESDELRSAVCLGHLSARLVSAPGGVAISGFVVATGFGETNYPAAVASHMEGLQSLRQLVLADGARIHLE